MIGLINRIAVHYRFFVACCVTVLGAGAQLWVLGRFDVGLLIVLFAATHLIYLFDRVADLRGEFRQDLMLLVLTCIAVVLLAGALSLQSSGVVGLTLVGLVPCLAYSWPGDLDKAHKASAKRYRGLKGVFVGGAVAVATVALPVVAATFSDPAIGVPSVAALVGLILRIAAWTTANSHVADFADHEFDRKQGVASLPVSIGLARARVAVSVGTGAMLLLGWACAPPAVEVVLAEGLIAALIVGAGYSRRFIGRRVWLAWWLDGLLMLELAIAWLAHVGLWR